MSARNLIVSIAAFATLSAAPAFASNVTVSLGLNLWPTPVQAVNYAPARVVVVAEPECHPLSYQIRRYPVERIRVIREVEYRNHGHHRQYPDHGWEGERREGRGYERLADNRRWDGRDERWEGNERRGRHDRGND